VTARVGSDETAATPAVAEPEIAKKGKPEKDK